MAFVGQVGAQLKVQGIRRRRWLWQHEGARHAVPGIRARGSRDLASAPRRAAFKRAAPNMPLNRA